MKDVKNNNIEILNVDNQGNVIPEAFPVSERTRKDHRKTSVGYTLIAVLLHILAFVPIIAVSTVLAVRTFNLMPYYSFWPFVGVIVVGVFGLIFLAVSLAVTRKKAKSNIAGQTAKIAITFVCLTSVFSLILTYIVPDIIANATQSTLFVEDLFYNGDSQAEKNAKLERDFIMYNVLNGNLNNYGEGVTDGDYSYKTLSKREEDQVGAWVSYYNEEINTTYENYMGLYEKSQSKFQTDVLDTMKAKQPRKYEMYEFVYNSYILNDYDYSFLNTIHRRIFAVALVDYVYAHSNYEQLIKEGFNNKKIKQLFDDNFDSFNHDGYQPFDDPLLLYAQIPGRMTVPVVLRLILNEGWQYSQGAYDEDGNVYFTEDGDMLYELYDPEARDAFVKAGGKFTYEDTRLNGDGSTINDKYGYNEQGWMVYESGVVKRPINWLVLDMLGDPMQVANVDINSLLGGLLGDLIGGGGDISGTVGSLLTNILSILGKFVDSVGDLVQEDVGALIQDVTGANLTLSLCIDDNGALNVSITPMNATYGMLGYMQASWVQSNNLLMAVINVMGLRNWLCIFGAIGVVLVIAAGVFRECGRRTRLRTAVSRDRIARANTAQKIANGELDPSEIDDTFDLAAEITPAHVAKLEKKQQHNRKLRKQAEELENEMFDNSATEQPVVTTAVEPVATAPVEPVEDTFNEPVEEPVKEKKSLFGKKKKQVEEPEELVEEPMTDSFDEVAEEPVKEKKSLFGRKKKEVVEDDFSAQPETAQPVEAMTAAPVATAPLEPVADTFEEPAEEPVKEKKSLFGKKKKQIEEPEELVEEPMTDSFDEVAEEPVKEKKSLFGKKKKVEEPENDFLQEAATDTLEEQAEEPVKEKKGLFGKKKKEAVEEPNEEFTLDSTDPFNEPVEEPVKEKKGLFGKKKKKQEEELVEEELTPDNDDDFIF